MSLSTPVFCFGSNSAMQLRERIENDSLIAYGSYLPGYMRIYAGYAHSWKGAAASIKVASVDTNDCVYGSIVYLTVSELSTLDKFEGISPGNDPFCCDYKVNHYRREWVDAIEIKITSDHPVERTVRAIAYIRNDSTWECLPSKAYMAACYKNISQFWPKLDGNGTVIIRDEHGHVHGEYPAEMYE